MHPATHWALLIIATITKIATALTRTPTTDFTVAGTERGQSAILRDIWLSQYSFSHFVSGLNHQTFSSGSRSSRRTAKRLLSRLEPAIRCTSLAPRITDRHSQNLCWSRIPGNCHWGCIADPV